MKLYKDLPNAVGNTPLIRLKRASEETGCEIYGKAEFMNPGQSVKDRAALFIIKDAVERGDVEAGLGELGGGGVQDARPLGGVEAGPAGSGHQLASAVEVGSLACRSRRRKRR